MFSLRTTLVRGGLAVALATGCLSLAGTTAAAAPGQEPAKEPAKAPIAVGAPHAAYAGTDTCLSCHQDYNAALTKGPHSHAFRAGTPMSPQGCQACHADTKAVMGCEGCHGPGKAHADAGGDKTKILRLGTMSPKDASATCASCHFRTQHTFWAGSQHDQRNVGCTSCHSIHKAAGEKQLKAASESELCAQCHRTIVNKQLKFAHMPVREGKLSCSSCHNVHGSQNVKLLKVGGSVSESCYSCHAEKRGPTLWEHAPVTENCATCHDPHGSNNERMLVAKQPFLCQRCHVTSRHPPTVYEGYLLNNSTNGNKIYGRSCVVCHQQVHGSNAPSGKAFLR
jgi:DmsE family decaheme c-type cytochrome